MDMQATLMRIAEQQAEQMKGLRHIARQNDRIIKITERNRTGPLRVFLSTMWNAFSEQLATNLGKFLAGLLLWLLAVQILGLDHLFEKLAG